VTASGWVVIVPGREANQLVLGTPTAAGVEPSRAPPPPNVVQPPAATPAAPAPRRAGRPLGTGCCKVGGRLDKLLASSSREVVTVCCKPAGRL